MGSSWFGVTNRVAGVLVGLLILFLDPKIGSSELRIEAADALSRALRTLYGDDCAQTIRAITNTAHGDAVERVIFMLRSRGQTDGKGVVVRVIEPDTIRGVAVLIRDSARAAGTDEIFAYLPEVGRVRRLAPIEGSGNVLGTALSFADLRARSVEDYVRVRAAGRDDELGCEIIEANTAPWRSAVYDVEQFCVDQVSWVPKWVDSFSRGKRLRRLSIETDKLRSIDGRSVPITMEVVSEVSGRTTRLNVLDYRIVDELPAKLFSVRNLSVGNAGSDRAALEQARR